MTDLAPRRAGRVTRCLHWVYFWVDLYGADGRPSHHKVLTAIGYIAALWVTLWQGSKMQGVAEITPEYVALLTLILGLPIGKGVLYRRGNNRAPGT